MEAGEEAKLTFRPFLAANEYAGRKIEGFQLPLCIKPSDCA
jgi:hypothetical protein